MAKKTEAVMDQPETTESPALKVPEKTVEDFVLSASDLTGSKAARQKRDLSAKEPDFNELGPGARLIVVNPYECKAEVIVCGRNAAIVDCSRELTYKEKNDKGKLVEKTDVKVWRQKWELKTIPIDHRDASKGWRTVMEDHVICTSENRSSAEQEQSPFVNQIITVVPDETAL